MKTIQDLIELLKEKAQDEKFGPGVIRTNLRKQYSEKFLQRYKVNEDAYWVGFYLADSKINDAKKLEDISKHQSMAVEWANELFEKYEVEDLDRQVIIDMIVSHHTTDHKFKESKIFTNVDSLAFLEPKGFMHMFASYWNEDSEKGFEESLAITMDKINEKVKLVDLDQTTIDEAKALYERIEWIVRRMGYEQMIINFQFPGQE